TGIPWKMSWFTCFFPTMPTTPHLSLSSRRPSGALRLPFAVCRNRKVDTFRRHHAYPVRDESAVGDQPRFASPRIVVEARELAADDEDRSEERRVGKEGRSRWAPHQYKKS